jgi:hypothetical protein
MRRTLVINLGVLLLILIGVEIFFEVAEKSGLIAAPKFKKPTTNWVQDTEVAKKELGPLRMLPPKYKHNINPVFAKFRDPLLEYMYLSHFDDTLADQEVRVQRKIANTDIPIYDVVYRLNYGRRNVENQAQKNKARRFVFAFGCSFTMGEGVTQGFDYPSQLAEKLDDTWKVYNFGHNAYGPNSYIKDFEINPIKFERGIAENEGVFVWLMIWEHPVRLFCPWNCYQKNFEWLLEKPEVIYDNNAFVVKGSYAESTSLKRKLFSLISKSSAVQHLGFLRPATFTNDEYGIFVKSIDDIVGKLKASGKNVTKKYIVMFHHFEGYDVLKKQLLESGYEIIEYFRVRDIVKIENPVIFPDPHPSSESFWYISEAIKNRLDADFPNER